MGTGRFLRRLLRIALSHAVSGRGARPHAGSDAGGGYRHTAGGAHAAGALARCRRLLSEARAERQRLVADLLRYGDAREVLIAREAAEAPGPRRDELRRSLDRLEQRLTDWFAELDAVDARIAALEADLAELRGAAGGDSQREDPGGRERRQGEGHDRAGQGHSGRRDGARPPGDSEVARHLAALGLTAMPASMVELKAAYRARLKRVHPDVGTGGSTEAAAAATVAFAELRKRFVQG